MTTNQGVNSEATLLCRISSQKQAEGYSLDFQEKGGRKYAERQGFKITRVWRVVESASKDSRSEWEEYITYATKGPEAHILIPKVDRSLRNFDDLALISKIPKTYGKALHFFDDGIVFHKDSPASDLLRLGIQGAVATWYSADLAQKTKKGMDEKASQGEWPEVAPYGYKNNKATKLIEIDPDRAHWVRRIKELSAKGIYSLDRIRQTIIEEGYPIERHKIQRNMVERIIRNPIYAGHFEWPKESGTLIKGKHEAIVSWDLHEAAIRGLERLNRPRYRKWNFPYAGLIKCGSCPEARAIVFEIKKGRFIYGHCTGTRTGVGCNSEYVRAEVLEEQFLNALRGIQITPEVSEIIIEEISKESSVEMMRKETHAAMLRREIVRLKGRIEQIYMDKLDGKVTETFWIEKNRNWQAELVRLQEKVSAIEEGGMTPFLPQLGKLLELSKRTVSLYNSANSEEKRELLNFTCSNFTLNAKTLSFLYKKPFDLLSEGVKTSNWLGLDQ